MIQDFFLTSLFRICNPEERGRGFPNPLICNLARGSQRIDKSATEGFGIRNPEQRELNSKMHAPRKFKRAFMEQLLQSLQVAGLTSKSMGLRERRDAVRLSSDVAMALARGRAAPSGWLERWWSRS